MSWKKTDVDIVIRGKTITAKIIKGQIVAVRYPWGLSLPSATLQELDDMIEWLERVKAILKDTV